MGIFDRFPYSSTHEMNLDFMLGKATEIAESLQEVQDGLSDIDTHKAQAEQAAQDAAQAKQAAQSAAQTASASARQAAQHKTDAEDAADRAEAASNLADDAVEQAQTAAQTAGTAAEGAIASATAAESRINAAATQAQTDVQTTATQAQTDVQTAANAATASATAAENRINTLAESLPEDFTELNNEVTDLKSALSDNINKLNYKAASFTKVGGVAHSSANDKVEIPIADGESFYVTVSTNIADYNIQIFQWRNGTSSSLASTTTSATRKPYKANGDIDAISVYIGAGVGDAEVYVLVEKDNSALITLANAQRTNDIIFNFPSLTSAEFVQGSLYNGVNNPSNMKCISTTAFFKILTPNYGKIIMRDADPNGRWKIRVSFYKDNYVFLSQTEYDYYTEIHIPQNAVYYQISISYYVNDVNVDTSPATLQNDCVYVWVDGDSVINKLQTEIDGKQDVGIPTDMPTYEYSGEKIDVKTHKMAYQTYMILAQQTTNTRQGCACYGDLLFLAHNTMDKISVFDLNSKALITNITLTAVSTYHCNNINFGTEKYDASDAFPLLYISMENSSERKCLVYRITISESVYSAMLVQTISYPSSATDGLYYPNCVLDNDKGIMYVAGYTTNSYTASEQNHIKYIGYKLPLLSDGDVTLDYASKLTEFVVKSMTATQGAIVHNGNIFQMFGLQEAMLCQISPLEKDFVTIIDTGISKEPESLFIWNEDLYVLFLDGTVLAFYFD